LKNTLRLKKTMAKEKKKKGGVNVGRGKNRLAAQDTGERNHPEQERVQRLKGRPGQKTERKKQTE